MLSEINLQHMQLRAIRQINFHGPRDTHGKHAITAGKRKRMVVIDTKMNGVILQLNTGFFCLF